MGHPTDPVAVAQMAIVPATRPGGALAQRRETLVGVMVRVLRQCKLFEIVRALASPGGFPGRLHGGQQQGNQDADDGNDHQQLDQGKPAP
jgi:hypothetical protein